MPAGTSPKTSKSLKGVRFCFLPPYFPELQPAERLWPLVDEAVANKRFDTLRRPLRRSRPSLLRACGQDRNSQESYPLSLVTGGMHQAGSGL
jgi:hypothetical protein